MRTDILRDSESLYNIEQVSERKIDKFNITASYYKVAVKDFGVQGIPKILKTFKKLFESIINRIPSDIPPNDLIRLTMDNPELDYYCSHAVYETTYIGFCQK